MGITEKMYRDILRLNVDVVTMGNHTWGKKDIFGFIDEKTIVRPANYPKNNPRKWLYDIREKRQKNCCDKFNWSCDNGGFVRKSIFNSKRNY